eukprot:1017530-Ditylum_brightwellii.AAC.1
MTNKDVPATPMSDPAKKRRNFSPPRNMEIDNNNSNAISVTPAVYLPHLSAPTMDKPKNAF